MGIEYTFEEGKIERESTNRLLNIEHTDTLSDFYTLHPEYSDFKELGEELERSENRLHHRAGRAVKRLISMMVTEGQTKHLPILMKYAKSLNRRLLCNKSDDTKYAFALDFVYTQVEKGFKAFEEKESSKKR